jgi:translation initiation factor IF-3
MSAGGDRQIERKVRINERIRAREVRLIDENGAQLGILPFAEALQTARDRGLDLIEVAPNAQPPVCRIMDFGKHQYQLAKRDREAKKKHKATEVRLLRMKPQIGEHDLQIKVRKLRELLQEGNKVRINLRFRGRERAHPEMGTKLFDRIVSDLSDIAQTEGPARFEGRMMNLMIAPKPGARAAAAAKAGKTEKTGKTEKAAAPKKERPSDQTPQTTVDAKVDAKEDGRENEIQQQAPQVKDPEDSGEAG